MKTTLQTLAAEVAALLSRHKRKADGIGQIQWVRDLCHEAHGRMFPDDWKYEFIGDALDSIAENESDDDDDLRDRFREWFDGAYGYTHDQTAWLASRTDRHGYADEAAAEFGGDMNTMQRIALGMLREAEEVFASVIGSLRARLEELEEAEEVTAD